MALSDNELAATAVMGVLARLGMDKPNYNPQVAREGDKVIVPDGADLRQVAKALIRKADEEDQKITVTREVLVPLWDGSIAMMKAIEEELGFATAESQFSFWGETKPAKLDIEIDFGKVASYAWGKFALPGMDGATVTMGAEPQPDGQVAFVCHMEVKRRFEPRARKMLDRMTALAPTLSLHRGKAFTLDFTEQTTWTGQPMIMPKITFFRPNSEVPIFKKSLELGIERNVFVPIRYSREMREMGESLKRGVLFAGPYGTGKTLLASYISEECKVHGWTFIYVKDANKLKRALEFSKHYQPAVVFCEDIDRVAGEKRTDAVNDILNQLDGIDTKGTELLTLLTSNNPDHINPAMRRPGRIDVLLEVTPPDAEACARMLKTYGGRSLREDIDLTEAGRILEGQSPAKVREALSRAKMETLRRTKRSDEQANGEDLAIVAKEVVDEGGLFMQKAEQPKGAAEMADGLEAAGRLIRQRLNGKTLPESLSKVYNEVREAGKEVRG